MALQQTNIQKMKSSEKIKKLLQFFTAFLIMIAFSLSFSRAQESVLDEYVRMGLESNLSLKQKKNDYEKSIYALKEAKGLFFPDLSLNARYTISDGGRIIEFPVGDLLNPVYSTLNTLTSTTAFPQVENQEFPFLRPTEHETKLRMIQPVFNTDIQKNAAISERLSKIKKADYDSYRRQLVAEIKKAYYHHIKALKIKAVLINSKGILEENKRVNESLFRNQKVTRDAVLRSEAELGKIQKALAQADAGIKTSAAFLNFLLNRDLNEEIVIEDAFHTDSLVNTSQSYTETWQNREELLQLEELSELNDLKLKMYRARSLPTLTAVVDYGYQGEEYSFTPDDDFVMASLVMSWNIFRGFQNKQKISQAKIEYENSLLKKQETEKMIELENIQNLQNLLAARKNIETSYLIKKSTQEAFRMVKKKYANGQANLLEFMDARSAMTNAGMDYEIALYDFLIQYAEFERSSAMYIIDNQSENEITE